MLIAQTGREASGQSSRYGRETARDHEVVALDPDQLAPYQDGEPVGQGSAAIVDSESDQAK